MKDKFFASLSTTPTPPLPLCPSPSKERGEIILKKKTFFSSEGQKKKHAHPPLVAVLHQLPAGAVLSLFLSLSSTTPSITTIFALCVVVTICARLCYSDRKRTSQSFARQFITCFFRKIRTDAHHHRLAHTYGPLDGSLYAKVLKQSKTPPSSPPLVVTTASGERSTSRFSDPSSSTSGGGGVDYHHLHHHHHHPAQFLNSPHVASTDSGISSAGIVRSGGGSSTHNRELGGSGSTSASPPHSGRSAESSGAGGGSGGVFDPPPTPSPVQQQQQSTLQRMPSIVETRAEIHRCDGRGDVMMGSSAPPPSLTATAELDQLLSGMLMNVQNIPDIRPEHRHFQRGDDIDVDSIQVSKFKSSRSLLFFPFCSTDPNRPRSPFSSHSPLSIKSSLVCACVWCRDLEQSGKYETAIHFFVQMPNGIRSNDSRESVFPSHLGPVLDEAFSGRSANA